MNRIIFILTLSAFLFSQQAEVTNIQAAQRTDGSQIVDITYDLLEDAIFEFYQVTVEVSMDGGNNWQTMNNVSGDVGDIGIAGIGKTLTWNYGQQFNETYSDQVKIRINATSSATIIDDSQEVPFEMIEIPAGDYTYGEGDTIKTIDYDYEMMKYEVTDYEYVLYLLDAMENGEIIVDENGVRGNYTGDGGYSPGEYQFISFESSKIAWNGEIFEVSEGYVNHPVTGVSWFGAWAFATYYGMELPDKYEWEKAARGNTGNIYPWGDELLNENANFRNSCTADNVTTSIGSYNGQSFYFPDIPEDCVDNNDWWEEYFGTEDGCAWALEQVDCYYWMGNDGFDGYIIDLCCALCYGAPSGMNCSDVLQTNDSPSFYGLYDMTGNVSEWIDDNPLNEVSQKGGNFTHNSGDSPLKTWHADTYSRSDTNSAFGFRCMRRLNN